MSMSSVNRLVYTLDYFTVDRYTQQAETEDKL